MKLPPCFSPRHRRRVLCVPALLLSLLAPGAHAATERVEVRWGDARRFELSRRLLQGGAVEVCAELQPGESVNWTFHAGQPLGFELFYRVGKRRFFVDRRHKVLTLQGQLQPQQHQLYCWRWMAREPKSTPLELMLRQ